MIQFTRLRLSGFKSFVEATELLVEPGMTGIVGPNGCGKSNLVEALRWVMGETSAKQMRGSEMDDVIFGGTSTRPPRNQAEVTLVLDNRARVAPAQFNDHDELEVLRRIERGSGSLYRVNGKDVRARDVQLLFADAATGARSTALVSQGRIGAIINAKPSDRRNLLEEAAGIGGLHSRRHEAEQRLRAAEANLERLDDVLSTLDGQLQSLKRQARHAARYRSLSEQIRATEAMALHLRWLAAVHGLEAARRDLGQGEGSVADLTAAAARAAVEQIEAATGLPGLRHAEAEAAARLHRLTVAREQLDVEEGRLAAARREYQQRLSQIDADLQREQARGQDTDQAIARLEAERADIDLAQSGEVEDQEIARERLETAAEEVARLEDEVQRQTAAAAAAEAQRAAAAKQAAEAESRRRRLAERMAQIDEQLRAAQADSVADHDLADAELLMEAAAEAVEEGRMLVEDGESARLGAQAARDAARDRLQAEAAARAKLRAEEQALREVLAEGASGQHPPLIDAVEAEPGYEAALAAAIGDDLTAPVDDAAADRRWTTLPALAAPPPLPAGTAPLSAVVVAPPALARRLSQTGIVGAEHGPALRHDLRPGQRLVSTGGDLWRWDGFTLAAGAPTAAATRLRQRNRLRDLLLHLAEAEARVELCEDAVAAANAEVETAAAAAVAARDRLRHAEGDAARARDFYAKLAQQAAAAAARLAALQDNAARLQADLDEAAQQEEAAREAQLSIPDSAEGRALLERLRGDLAERRAALTEARSRLDRLTREAAERRRRLDAIAAETASWRERAEAGRHHREELLDRREQTLEELERLAAAPMEIEEKRQALLDQLQQAEAGRRDAAGHLAQAEHTLAEADRRLKAAEQDLAKAREDRVRREAAVEAATQTCRSVAGRIAERQDCTPEELRGRINAEAEIAPLEELERRLEKLTRDRDGMGAVNLRAEEEAAELDGQIATLHAEREDLIAAIAKLRQGIAEINREGRDRLLASFRAVDGHFRELFVHLFGGGRAELALTESDDPLQAGLEIMASPPGKRLQVLSLLSGGEQALTALALLFAVFMTNPAPICVLDEVDAPLDDANVDRFCALVEDIAQRAKTRFLVITHHRMTMARVDRLFGITMAERGVSQLVSVDLKAAELLRETA